MDTRKVGNVTIDTSKLKRLEEIVKLMCDVFDDYDDESLLLLAEIRELTGIELDDDTLSCNYCGHYYSHTTLEETVSALFNNGKYPDIEEYDISCWKTSGKTDLTDEYIYNNYKYGRDEKIDYTNVLEKFSLIELLTWIEKQFPDWNREDTKNSSGLGLDHYTFELEENEEYGIPKYVIVSVSDDLMVDVSFKNIDENIRNDLTEYMKSLGNTVYYNK